MESQDLIRQAHKKVIAKKGFYWHFVVYLVCSAFFILLNLLTSPGEFWAIFPMASWGIGLAFHYVGVFGIPGVNILGSDWEKKQLEKEILKLREREQLLLEQPKDDLLDLNEKDYLKLKEWEKQHQVD